ncbi:MAG TPA: hypothetical protein VK444_06440 [Methanobacteriaceae archaeon]|nr:hypothetical protein [Methanobacteriaceae archaeon]
MSFTICIFCIKSVRLYDPSLLDEKDLEKIKKKLLGKLELVYPKNKN